MKSAARFRYSYDMEEDWLGSRYRQLPIKEASMKKLINDEMSRRPHSQQNGPSIVARLMGMDVLPLETKSTVSPIKKRGEPARTNSSNDGENLRSSVIHSYSNSNSFEHGFTPICDCSSSKPKRREHPQEEELQKFKKEFEAWQAARFKECSRYAEVENASTWVTKEKSIEPKSHLVKWKSSERRHLCNYGENPKIYAAKGKEFSALPCRTSHREKEQVPTKIVVLKPGPDRIWSSEDSWTSFSGSSEERGSIEDFLEEVKERLKQELHGKIPHKGPIVPGSRITRTTITEKPQDPQKIARQISSRVRESVTRDLESGADLVRSESTRSHRSDIQLDETSSPEFIGRDTRRFLAERLKNVLKRESDVNIPIGVGSDFSRSCLLEEKRVFQKPEEIVKMEEQEEQMHTRSFRDEHLSPKNLVRSLSAPVPGTSFGKLLLEDRHVITGAHIRRKHEHSIDNLLAGTKKGKKEKESFSLREKVHNFRSTFTLRRRLFGKRMPSMADLHTCEPSFMTDIMNGPTVVLDHGERYENSTEVPPSPASVCSSSSQEEFWRPSNDLSPISSPKTTSGESPDVTHVFGETTSTQNELQRQLSQSSSERAVEDTTKHEPCESKLPELEDRLAVYVRALLVASGLYGVPPHPQASRSDPDAKYISTSVYEEVESSYQQPGKEASHNSAKDGSDKGTETDHRVLYDLVNEALSEVLRQPVISRFRKKKISVLSDLQQPCGSKLMDLVWGFISLLVYPPGDDSSHFSIDSMVARDLGSAPWFQTLDVEVNAIGAEIEGSILRSLISEVARDMKST